MPYRPFGLSIARTRHILESYQRLDMGADSRGDAGLHVTKSVQRCNSAMQTHRAGFKRAFRNWGPTPCRALELRGNCALLFCNVVQYVLEISSNARKVPPYCVLASWSGGSAPGGFGGTVES